MRVGDLRSPLRAGSGKAGRTLTLAVPLVILVIVAAGLAGTSHFAGARWSPSSHKAPRQAFPTSHATRPPAPKLGTAQPGDAKIPVWLLIAIAAICVAVLVAFLLRWLGRRRLPAAPSLHAAPVQAARAAPQEPKPEPEVLLSGIELALQKLDEQRDPADAIVQAWLGLQETAEQSGIVRQRAETPTEFTARIMASAFTDDSAVRTLLKLYLRTRFGDHAVTAADVVTVRAALQQLVATWQVTSR